MEHMLQLTIGILLGIIAQNSFNWWVVPENNHFQIRKTYVKEREISNQYEQKMTQDEIENVPVQPTLEEFQSRWDSLWNGQAQINKITDGVYVATNYSWTNVIIIEAPEGLIIVDTTESPVTAEAYRVALRKINNKPIKAIILTDFHLDHIQGVDVFTEDKSNPPDVWSHYLLPEIIKGDAMVEPRMHRGGIQQFGTQLNGKSGYKWPKIPHNLDPVPLHFPNRLVRQAVEHVQIAGMNVTLLHIPGETDDLIAIWLPDKRVLLPGDNIYACFPNLYAIRGTPARHPLTWVRSLQLMRSLGADFLVPSHGASVAGRQEIYDLFTAYSASLQYVHDQSVRRLNEFQHPDEVGRAMKLPSSLASHPYLGEFYGTVEWSAKAVYHRYVGWFSGDPVELFPLTPSERAQAFVNLLGIDRILDEADNALRNGNTQWSLELCSHVRRIQPKNLRARWLWMQTLRTRAAEQTNPSARNLYLTAALDSYDLIEWEIKDPPLIDDVAVALDVMKYRLKAELTDGVNKSIRIHFTDTGDIYRLHILYSVLEVNRLPKENADAADTDSGEPVLATTESVWLDVLSGKIQPATSCTNGQIQITGSLLEVRQFLSYFQI